MGSGRLLLTEDRDFGELVFTGLCEHEGCCTCASQGALMLVDANLLLYAVDETSTQHPRSRDWLTAVLSGDERVGLPWLSLGAFLRITTNPRAVANARTAAEAWAFVEEWLSLDSPWVPTPGERHRAILGDLVQRYDPRANLVTDAQMAALAIEHGLKLYSTDTDFARFREIDWINPIA